MKVWVAIWEDRHTDTDALVFSTPEIAVEWARETVREMGFGDLDEELTEPMQRAGWLYRGQYSPEGDGIFVVEREVDAEPLCASG